MYLQAKKEKSRTISVLQSFDKRSQIRKLCVYVTGLCDKSLVLFLEIKS